MFTDNSASWMFDPGPKESREEEAWKGQGQEDACMGQEINVAYMYYIVQSIWCITGIWEASDALNLPNYTILKDRILGRFAQVWRTACLHGNIGLSNCKSHWCLD
jgi:hypothetical protein